MLRTVMNLFFSGLVLMLTAHYVPNFQILSTEALLFAVLFLTLFNLLIPQMFMVMRLPFNGFIFFVSAFIFNALLLRVIAGVLDGFDVVNWEAAALGSLALSLVHVLFRKRDSAPVVPTF